MTAPLDRPGNDALKGRNRLRLVMSLFAACFLVIGARVGELSLLYLDEGAGRQERPEGRLPRPDITDRDGRLLASDVRIPSLFANPRQIIDVDEAVELLTSTLPELEPRELRRRLTQDKAFVWLKREISPEQRQNIHDLGIPGIYFRDETRRLYPMGRLASHVLGYVDVDSRGLAGVEKYLDDQGAIFTASLADPGRQGVLPVQLALDASIQHVMAAEIAEAITHYKAEAGGGILLNVKTGEVVALVSLPDFNPNTPREAQEPTRINRMTGGVYELGSVVKTITFAMAFEAGVTNLEGRYDARFPLVIGRSRIDDYHAKRRVLTVPEVFMYSSNIGTARMALDVGLEGHQAFLKTAGLFDRLVTEVPEAAAPLLPPHWGKLTTVTAAFGHGFAVQPLQGASVVAAFMNGGMLVPPTFLKRDEETAQALARRLVSEETGRKMRYLFRLNVEKGTAAKAEAPGYRVGGKTGTAEKVVNGRYNRNRLLNSFIGAFPMDDPAYVILIMLDEPKPLPETYGFATSGWNAVPTAGKIIRRIAPLLGIEPQLTEEDRKKLAKAQKVEEND
jgi:cell division protein FtsI (penicillin-binding protein 3)